jgi:hypothetical protein
LRNLSDSRNSKIYETLGSSRLRVSPIMETEPLFDQHGLLIASDRIPLQNKNLNNSEEIINNSTKTRDTPRSVLSVVEINANLKEEI